MPDNRVRSQQADLLPANTTFHHPSHHQPHGQNLAIPLPAGEAQQQVYQERVPVPAEHVAMQGMMLGQRPLQPPYYDAAQHQLEPQPDYLVAPYMYVQQDGEVAQGVPAQPLAQADAPENRDGLFGYAPADPAVGPPQYFPGPEALPNQVPVPLPNVPLMDGLRFLAGRYINNPYTHVNMLRIEPGPAGRFRVSMVLEMADIL